MQLMQETCNWQKIFWFKKLLSSYQTDELLAHTILQHNDILYTVNPQFEPWGLINFMALNNPGSNQERVEIETITVGFINLGGLGFNLRPGLYSRKYGNSLMIS